MDAPKWPWVLQEGLLLLVAVLMGLGVVFGHLGQQTPGVVIHFSKWVLIMKRSWLKDLEELIKLFWSL